MPTAIVTTADGRKARLTFPDGTTEAQGREYIDKWLAEQNANSSVQFPQGVPSPADSIDPGEAGMIGIGKGMVDIGRGLGLVDPETAVEKQAMDELRQRQPTATTLGEIGGQAAPFVPIGMGVGAIASTPLRIAAASALGATEGGVIAQGTGGDVVEGAGIGLLFGGASEVVLPVLTSLAGQAFRKITGRAPKGTLVDAAGRPTAELASALEQAGMSFEDLSGAAVEQIKKSGAIPADQGARLARATTEEIPLSTGDVTQNFAQQATEQRMLGNVGEASSEAFRQFKLRQSQAIDDALRKNFKFEVGREEAGTLIKESMTGRKTLLRQKKNDLYNEAYAAAKDKGGIPFFTDNIEKAIPDEATLKDLAITAEKPEAALRKFLERYGLLEGEVVPESLTVENFERFRKGLNAIERSDTSGAIKVATGPIKDALDREADELVTTLKMRGIDLGESVFKPLEEARATVRTMKTEFSPQSIAGRLTGLKPDGFTPLTEASGVYEKLSMRSTKVEDVRKVMATLAKAPDGEAARAALQSNVMMDLIDAGFGTESRKVQGVKVFNPTAFKRRLNLIGKDKVQAIFSNNRGAYERLLNIDAIASDLIPTDRAVPKGSADVILDLASRLGLISISGKVPGGAFVVEAIKRPIQSVRSGVQANRAMAGSPEVLKIRGTIDRTFPSLAAALGIAAVENIEE